jgi:hypothetical protein
MSVLLLRQRIKQQLQLQILVRYLQLVAAQQQRALGRCQQPELAQLLQQQAQVH